MAAGPAGAAAGGGDGLSARPEMPAAMSAAGIVPRWEWRCFAPSLVAMAEAAAMPAGFASRESDEIYLLDGTAVQNAKIRDGVLDIKRLRRTDADGLELWEPVFKAGFPLSRSDLAAACAAWTPPLETLRRDGLTIQQFIDALVARRPGLRIVRVHKSRRSFGFDACAAEWVRLRLDSRAIESFAIEHEDPAQLLAALRRLGLDGRGNTNYPEGLRRFLEPLEPDAA